MSNIPSPSKSRGALKKKSINIRNSVQKERIINDEISPRKTKNDISKALEKSPIKLVLISPLKPKSEFAFYEETAEQRAMVLLEQVSLNHQLIHDENDYEGQKENMSNQKLENVFCVHKRKPLKDLSIHKYPGSITFKNQEEMPLTLHITNSQVLPSYLTPPRDKRLRSLFTTKRHSQVGSRTHRFLTTDDICYKKVVRKLNFPIYENNS